MWLQALWLGTSPPSSEKRFRVYWCIQYRGMTSSQIHLWLSSYSSFWFLYPYKSFSSTLPWLSMTCFITFLISMSSGMSATSSPEPSSTRKPRTFPPKTGSSSSLGLRFSSWESSSPTLLLFQNKTPKPRGAPSLKPPTIRHAPCCDPAVFATHKWIPVVSQRFINKVSSLSRLGRFPSLVLVDYLVSSLSRLGRFHENWQLSQLFFWYIYRHLAWFIATEKYQYDSELLLVQTFYKSPFCVLVSCHVERMWDSLFGT